MNKIFILFVTELPLKDLNTNNRMSLERISSFGPLPIRIIAGIAFIIQGLPKFSNIHGTQGLLGSFGLPPELALPIGLLETIRGFALIFGIFARIDSYCS
jgi:putative oxidoreductase